MYDNKKNSDATTAAFNKVEAELEQARLLLWIDGHADALVKEILEGAEEITFQRQYQGMRTAVFEEQDMLEPPFNNSEVEKMTFEAFAIKQKDEKTFAHYLMQGVGYSFNIISSGVVIGGFLAMASPTIINSIKATFAP